MNEFRCYAKASRDCVSVDEMCLGRARNAFTIARTRAGSCPDGTSLPDDHEGVEGVCVNRAITLLQYEIDLVCGYPPCDGSTPPQLCGATTCVPSCVNKGDPCCVDSSSGFFFCCAGHCAYDYEAQRSSCSGCGEVGEACCPGNVCYGTNCCGGYCTAEACQSLF
jgi:hypothetical protein